MELTDTFEIKNGNRHFNYFKCIQYLQQQGRNIYGSSYSIHKSQIQPLYRLLAYASQNSAESNFYGIDIHKGLLITGAQNSGKTCLMHLLKPFFQPQQQYIIRSSREIVAYCKLFGKNTVEKYLSNKTYYCFDDLGLEHATLDNEVLKEILQFRLLHEAKHTHIITRLDNTALTERYDNDFSTMLYHNLNHIELTKSFNL